MSVRCESLSVLAVFDASAHKLSERQLAASHLLDVRVGHAVGLVLVVVRVENLLVRLALNALHVRELLTVRRDDFVFLSLDNILGEAATVQIIDSVVVARRVQDSIRLFNHRRDKGFLFFGCVGEKHVNRKAVAIIVRERGILVCVFVYILGFRYALANEHRVCLFFRDDVVRVFLVIRLCFFCGDGELIVFNSGVVCNGFLAVFPPRTVIVHVLSVLVSQNKTFFVFRKVRIGVFVRNILGDVKVSVRKLVVLSACKNRVDSVLHRVLAVVSRTREFWSTNGFALFVFVLFGRMIIIKRNSAHKLVVRVRIFHPRVITLAQFPAQQFGRWKTRRLEFVVKERVFIVLVVRHGRESELLSACVFVCQSVLPVLRPQFVYLRPLVFRQVAVVLAKTTS